MTKKFEPGVRTSPRGIIALSLLFIVFGIAIIPMSLTALRSGAEIPLLSHDRAIHAGEGFGISFLAILIGVGGIWAVLRKR